MEKSTIYTSSDHDKLAFILPRRKLDLSILDESIIRVFGSVFSSIVIEAFLNIDKKYPSKSFGDIIYSKKKRIWK